MNGYNFTDRVRMVIQMAREEAVRLHHEYVGTEHLLLGIICEGEGVAAAVLTNLNVDLEDVQQKVEEIVKIGKSATRDPKDLPYTSRAKKVLELAMTEARELNNTYVGTEHLLLGLLREEKGIAAQVLLDAGLNLESTRAETLRLLGDSRFGEARKTAVSGGDQQFKTAIALIELHRLRVGSYPDSLDDLHFLGGRDRGALAGVRYEKLSDGYALDVVIGVGETPDLSYPSDFWRGLGLRRTNVGRSGAN
jgi:ATP-dependent Clp protease ATP-binding subunit ClpA